MSTASNEKMLSKRCCQTRCTPRRSEANNGGTKAARLCHTTPDRFIPRRDCQEFASYALTSKDAGGQAAADTLEDAVLREKLYATKNIDVEQKILSFTPKSADKTPQDEYWHYTSATGTMSTKHRKYLRKYPTTACKVLDAPSLLNDFYLNLLDWGSNNKIAVGLGTIVYLYNTGNDHIEELYYNDSSVCPTSLRWNGRNTNILAVGISDSQIQVWDVQAKKVVHKLKSRGGRAGCLSWHPTSSHVLSSGCQRGQLSHYDLRMPHYLAAVVQGHSMDVCGLEWSPSGRYLASGGNDNVVKVWDTNFVSSWIRPPLSTLQHKAAVKAMAWCPVRTNVLATGGGTADRTISIWNASSGDLERSITTASQITALLWPQAHNEIVTAHGFPDHHISIHSADMLSQLATLEGHKERLLHMTISPDNSTIVSASADETLRFWKYSTKSHKPRLWRGLTTNSEDTKALQCKLFTIC